MRGKSAQSSETSTYRILQKENPFPLLKTKKTVDPYLFIFNIPPCTTTFPLSIFLVLLPVKLSDSVEGDGRTENMVKKSKF